MLRSKRKSVEQHDVAAQLKPINAPSTISRDGAIDGLNASSPMRTEGYDQELDLMAQAKAYWEIANDVRPVSLFACHTTADSPAHPG